jgi:hypothetical protein
VIVYHEGHTGSGVQIGWPLISWLLRRGWEIYCVDMLLRGLNAVDASPGLSNHNDLALHEQTAAMHPIAFMLEPLRWIVDHAFSPPTDGPLLLVGRSGGGLMSYLYSAVDERISGAVAIGGGVPLSQRLETSSGDVGDYEQFAPSFYDLARHEDLMVAAAAAGLLLVFNRNDPDCFALRTDHPFGPYISKEAARFGGGLQVFVDPHHSEHDLGPDSYSVLAQFLSRYERGLVARSRVGS